MQDQNPPIKRALISVTDKTGIVEFARALSEEFDVEIVSTGGTAKALEAAGIPVRSIESLTGFPELMDGRVKTLHPKVHGGLLARRDDTAHLVQAAAHDIGLIDMIVVNLYAFEATVAKPNVDYAEAIENIDIGGPSMLRSAAKNHASVTVVTQSSSYEAILEEMRLHAGATTLATRKCLALEVFRLTSAYDNAIYNWLYGALQSEDNLCQPEQTSCHPERTSCHPERSEGSFSSSSADAVQDALKTSIHIPFMNDKRLFLTKVQDLRYGENPHQKAAFYKIGEGGNAFTLANARQLQGKELSYNNYLDLEAAWSAVREFTEPTTVVVKHLTPCGIASDAELAASYRRAYACDPVSAYGGVMAFNKPVTAELIQAIYENKQFIEALIAPDYEEKALELLAEKPNARVLITRGVNPPGEGFDYRSVEGGMLCMEADAVLEDANGFTVASKRQPTAEELEELLFAWRACKAVKSNAIVITQDKATLGIGAGQPNRLNSAELAIKQAGEGAQGAVAASDAFIPFADSLELLIAAGITAVIQPGGSIRDEEVLAAADAAGITMVFTGHRHFRH